MADFLSSSLLSSLGSLVLKPQVKLSYNGQDISSIIQPSLMDLNYKESFKANAQSDTLDIRIADPEGKFRESFTLDTYATINCTIFLGTSSKVLPVMYIKGIKIEQDKHSGTTVRLSCTSIAPQSPFRLERKSQAFPQPNGQQTSTTLKDTAQQICSQDGLQLQYLPKTNPTIQRADQHDHSDAYFLQRLCTENDFHMKVVNNTLYIRDMKDVESLQPLGTIVCPSKLQIGGWQNQGIIKWEYSETVEDIYGSSTVSYTDPSTGKTVTGTATDPNQPAEAPHLRHHKWYHPDGSSYDHITLSDDTDHNPGPQGD